MSNSNDELYQAFTTAKIQKAKYNLIEDVSTVQSMVMDPNEPIINKTGKRLRRINTA